MKFFVFLLFNVLINSLFGQTTLTKREAVEDIYHYFDTIKFYHPNMYWHTPKSVVDSCIEDMIGKCYDSMPVYQLCYLLARAQGLWDDHTGLNGRWYKGVNTERVFPKIYFKDHKIYLEDNDLEIITINSVPVDSILDYLKMNYGADVSMRWLESMICINYDFQGSVSDCGIYPPYKVAGKTKENRDTLVILDGIDIEILLEEENIFAREWNDPYPYHFELYPEEKIAIIRYNEVFRMSDYPEVDSLLGNFFQGCHKNNIRHLFFDVSRNEGGYTRHFTMFLPYIAMDKKKSYRRTIIEPNNEFTEILELKSIFPEGTKGVKFFKKNIYIYQSFYSQSATPDFCACMKVLTNAVLVGTETGSGLPLYATSKPHYLPNSGIRFNVSNYYWKDEFPKLPRTKEGFLLPDIEYPWSVEHRLNIEDCKKIIKLKSNLKSK